MGRVAYSGRTSGSLSLQNGQEPGPQGRPIRSRSGSPGWKHLGRPAFLPVPVPLDLMAG
jgi:hypothetical protein